MKILLMGNPNVGKSVVFSRLTGVHVIASNYPGTTVGYMQGSMKLGDERADVIDVPGTYTLEPANKAEQIALEVLKSRKGSDVVINVVEATNLERSLNLTLQLLNEGVPLIVVLTIIAFFFGLKFRERAGKDKRKPSGTVPNYPQRNPRKQTQNKKTPS